MADSTLDSIALELLKVAIKADEKRYSTEELLEKYEKVVKKVYDLNDKCKAGEYDS